MKNPAALAVATLTFLVAPSALALPIVDVGGVDTLVSYGNISPSAASQADFIADYFNLDVADVGYTKLEGVLGDSSGEGDSWTQASDDSDVWYLDFSQFIDFNPFAFLIKTGNHVQYQGSTYNTFLYTNSNNYGVVDLSIFTRSKGKVEMR